MSGFIYFIEAAPLCAIKIGFSDSYPERRLKELQTGCPGPLKLLAFVEGSVGDERCLHRTFSALRMHGEWFRYAGDLRFLVAALGRCNGSAPRVLFDRAMQRIAEQENDHELDYVEMPLGRPFRGSE